MESFIDVRIRELLGCNLCDLRDEDLANRICMAFFKQYYPFPGYFLYTVLQERNTQRVET